MRRLLDLLRDYWENPQVGENIVAYVVKREKLVEMAAFAQDNIRSAQDHQTIWYDKKAESLTWAKRHCYFIPPVII